MIGIGASYEDIAVFLDQQGERYAAVMVRNQTASLKNCRAANERTLREFYALREKYEPSTAYRHHRYRSPPESDG